MVHLFQKNNIKVKMVVDNTNVVAEADSSGTKKKEKKSIFKRCVKMSKKIFPSKKSTEPANETDTTPEKDKEETEKPLDEEQSLIGKHIYKYTWLI